MTGHSFLFAILLVSITAADDSTLSTDGTIIFTELTNMPSTIAFEYTKSSILGAEKMTMICLYMIYWLVALSIVAYLCYKFFYKVVDSKKLEAEVMKKYGVQPISSINPPDINVSKGVDETKNKVK